MIEVFCLIKAEKEGIYNSFECSQLLATWRPQEALCHSHLAPCECSIYAVLLHCEKGAKNAVHSVTDLLLVVRILSLIKNSYPEPLALIFECGVFGIEGGVTA